jgi:predicted phage terminase large subunit-like protein
LCDRLQTWAATPNARLVVSMPPRHGKSELVSRRLPAWLLGHHPDDNVLVCSYGASLANEMNADVQRIMDGDAYARTFPGTRLSRRGGAEAARRADLAAVVGRRGVLRSAGAGGPIVGKGFTFGIIDDPVKNRAEAESPTIRERVRRWYSADFASRCEPDARILVTMTRYHEDDLVGEVLRQALETEGAEQWETLVLPAVALGGDGKHPGDPRDPGEALWPARYPLSRLKAIRARSEYDWYSLYQQDPRQGAASEWPASHFGEHLWFSDWPPLQLRVVAVDASKGVGENGDYTAIVAAGYDHGHVWAEAWLERLPAEGVVERTLDVCASFLPDVCVVESNLFEELFLAMMHRRAAERGVPFPGLPMLNMVAKEVRIRRLGADLANKKIHVRATPGGRLLVDQLRQFPLATHDDGPDALEMGKRALVDLWNGRQKRKR